MTKSMRIRPLAVQLAIANEDRSTLSAMGAAGARNRQLRNRGLQNNVHEIVAFDPDTASADEFRNYVEQQIRRAQNNPTDTQLQRDVEDTVREMEETFNARFPTETLYG